MPADTPAGGDGLPAPRPARLRLGFLTHLHVGRDAPDAYRIGLELFEAAEALGYDSGWVAQHHFLDNDARLPSSLAFLAAVSQRTRRIHLGTAIVILPLEDPLRLAEDAAVVDALSGGRLQLGLGTGGAPESFAAFGQDVAARRERYADGLRVIQRALAGAPINQTDARLYPPAPTLAARLWESTLSAEGGARIGGAGNGLLLARTAFQSQDRTDVAQWPVAQAYLDAAVQRGTPPRIGLSRAVYPADDRRTAVAHLEAGVAPYVNGMVARGYFAPGMSQEEAFRRSYIHCGHPDEVIASLQTDRLLPHTTDLIVQAHPGLPTPAQYIRALERIAREVAPALGWRPAPVPA